MIINKQQLVDAVIVQLEQQLTTAQAASQQAHDSATHSENVAENKYDTLGLEAAYLAHGQSLRIEQLKLNIDDFRQLALLPAVDTVALGSIVLLEDDGGHQRYILLGPGAGGLSIESAAGSVQLVTPSAPLGAQLLGKSQFDELTLDIAGHRQFFSIVEVQ